MHGNDREGRKLQHLYKEVGHVMKSAKLVYTALYMYLYKADQEDDRS